MIGRGDSFRDLEDRYKDHWVPGFQGPLSIAAQARLK